MSLGERARKKYRLTVGCLDQVTKDYEEAIEALEKIERDKTKVKVPKIDTQAKLKSKTAARYIGLFDYGNDGNDKGDA